MSYKQNAWNESILVNKSSFKAFDSFAENVNNNLSFDKFMMNCKIVTQEFSSNKSKDQNNAKESAMNHDADEYIIMHISEEVQLEL